jgi:hypothetical protein
MRTLIDRASLALSWEDEGDTGRRVKYLRSTWPEELTAMSPGTDAIPGGLRYETPFDASVYTVHEDDVYHHELPSLRIANATTYGLLSGNFRKNAPVRTATREWQEFFEGPFAKVGLWFDEPHVASLNLVEVTQLAANPLRADFERLANEWEDDTWAYSFIERKAMHRAYQRIIGMGHAVVILILERLQECGPDHWFWALEMITGENPAAGTAGMEEATEAWLSWGREREFI